MNKRLWFLLAVMMAFAVPSFAQFYQNEATFSPQTVDVWYEETSYEQGQYMDNPCTSVQDWVWVNYSAYASGMQAQANASRYFFDESTSMGGMYAASGASSVDVGYGNAISLRQYHKVNTADNFHVVTVINFNPATEVMSLSLETACGNGMPDSAQ